MSNNTYLFFNGIIILAYGIVKLGYVKSTDKFYAVKIMSKFELLEKRAAKHAFEERHALFELDFHFLNKLYGTFQTAESLYFVLQYCPGGDLYTHLRKAGKYSNNVAKFYASQVILGLERIHATDYAFRDLKPENLCIDERGNVCVIDFGFAKKVDKGGRLYSKLGIYAR
jgi:serine/threonine protein kinase